MKRIIHFIALALLLGASSPAAQHFEARGLILKVDKSHHSLVISCEKIPQYMDAMVMSFAVRDPKELEGLTDGTMVDFILIVTDSSSYIEKIQVHHYEGVEQDPLTARRLKMMVGMTDSSPAAQELQTGDAVPDFRLIDQNRRDVTLAQFSGKVVVLTFTYTHCALPNFCFRISNNFRQLQKRFTDQMGRQLILLTITFDPLHDTPEVLAQYTKTWNANPDSWRALTGDPSAIAALAAEFGMSYWADEGLMNHSLHTVVIGCNGKLVANLEGNEYTASELGDLVATLLTHPAAPGSSSVQSH
jgi:protein SCO1